MELIKQYAGNYLNTISKTERCYIMNWVTVSNASPSYHCCFLPEFSLHVKFFSQRRCNASDILNPLYPKGILKYHYM